jgi:micrococcal nuclease
VTIVLVPVFVLQAYAGNFTGKVVGISDGDTITVLHNGRGEKIRLYSIDCPVSASRSAPRRTNRLDGLPT